MNITFFKNLSDFNVVNKNLTTLKSSVLVRNQPLSIDSPNILVDFDAIILESNYCFIDSFERYYFIQSIESTSRGLNVVCEKSDVLMSFKTYLNDINCVVKRQESKYNKYLIDEKQEVYSYNRIQTIPFNAGFSGEALILAIAGGSE